MAQVRVGVVPYAVSRQAQPLRVAVADPIDSLELVFTGIISVPAGGAVWLEDDMLRVLRRIQMTIGGRPFKIIGDNSQWASGGRLAHHFTKILYASAPLATPPAAAEGDNAFTYSMKIPFTLPEALSRKISLENRKSTILKTGGEDIDFIVDWGAITDATATANVSITNAQVEVIANTDPLLVGLPRSLALLKENSQQLPILAGLNTAEELDLNRIGNVPYSLIWNIDNDLQDDISINRITIKANVTDILMDESWDALKAAMQDAVGRQVPADLGVNLILYDEGQAGDKILPAGDVALVRKLAATLDHDALTATYRLVFHHYYIETVAGAVAESE